MGHGREIFCYGFEKFLTVVLQKCDNKKIFSCDQPPMAATVLRPSCGIPRTDASMLAGIHTTRKDSLMHCTCIFCSPLCFADSRPWKVIRFAAGSGGILSPH